MPRPRFNPAPLVISAAIMAALWFIYQRALLGARRALDAPVIRVPTSAGGQQYAADGAGAPLLIAHGTFGGATQGLVVTIPLENEPIRRYSIARSGYDTAPIEPGRTVEGQADAYAALLDALGIDRAPVLAVSTAALSALAFAIRYPDRCAGLILIGAVTEKMIAPPSWSGRGYDTKIAASRPALVASMLLRAVVAIMPLFAGLNPFRRRSIPRDPEQRAMAAGMARTMIPGGAPRGGMRIDIDQIAEAPDLALEAIRAPTLLVHGTTDALIPADHSRKAAVRIPGARLVLIEGGNHDFFVTHENEVFAAIKPFIHERIDGSRWK